MLCEWRSIEILEMNVKEDHIHMIYSVPLKIIDIRSNGNIKGKILIKLFKSYPALKRKPYWGNYFFNPWILCSAIGLGETKKPPAMQVGYLLCSKVF